MAINLAKNLAGIFATFIIIITGGIIFLNSMIIDYKSVIYSLKICIPAGIIAGMLGYNIGKILQSSDGKAPKKKKSKDSDLLIDDLLINDLNKISREKDDILSSDT